MKERPILFSAPMVRAILSGYKTQTRRVIKSQPLPWANRFEPAPFKGYGKPGEWIQMTVDEFSQRGFCKCPYGITGDRLWVKETFALVENDKGAECLQFAENVPDPQNYKPWRPSIFMPRWASRILLEIDMIRVERLQDISEMEAGAEIGINGHTTGKDAIPAFKILWDSINDKRGFGWDTNPWIWQIIFHRIEIDNG